MSSGLRGRHALVTGGSRGIGLAVAGALTQAGASVTILARDRRALDTAVAEGKAAAGFSADVTDVSGFRRAIEAAVGRGGPVDVLISNAGGAESASFRTSDAAVFQRMLDLNLMSLVHAAQSVLGAMTERGFGRIVAVASTAGLKGYPYVSAYCAAKHAVLGLVRALALETASKGITVNAVCPGFTDTDLVAQSLDTITAKTGRSRDEALAEIVKHNPQGRLVEPQEVADAVLWLCGEGARSVTGQAIAVAGGEI